MGLKTKGVLTFLLVSFGLAWATILVAHFGWGLSMSDPGEQLLVVAPIAFAPAIAAVVVRRWVTREGFRDACLRPRARAAWRYYLVAWAGPVLVLAATVGLAMATGLYRPDLSSPRAAIASLELEPVGLLLMLAAPVVLVPAFWGEEFGWRSYLQQRVSRSPLRAALITGVIWAAWHYPLVFTDYTDYPDPFLGIVMWTLLIVSQAIILAWLFRRSGTVWVPCLAHAGNNMIIGGLTPALLVEGGGLGPYQVGLLELAPLALLGVWIVSTGRLSASRAAGTRTPVAEVAGATRA